jgi:hypothetical protein
MELGIQVISTAKPKMKLVRKYAILTGSNCLSFKDALDLTARSRAITVEGG